MWPRNYFSAQYNILLLLPQSKITCPKINKCAMQNWATDMNNKDGR